MPKKIVRLSDLLTLKADKVYGPMIRNSVCATDRYIADYLNVPCFKFQEPKIAYAGDNLIELWANLPLYALHDEDVINYQTLSLPRIRLPQIHSLRFSPLGKKIYTGPSLLYLDVKSEDLNSLIYADAFINLISLRMMTQMMTLNLPKTWDVFNIIPNLQSYLTICDNVEVS